MIGRAADFDGCIDSIDFRFMPFLNQMIDVTFMHI